ncbi:F-box domain-containing protein [Pleurotus pulmonarius]
MSQKTTPRVLPTELVEKIIETLWLSAFSNTDRIKFMTASVLISKAWTHLYSRVSSRDTVIPSVKYAKYFHTYLLDESSVIFNKSTHNMPNEHCRSLRFDVESPSVQTPSHLNSKFVHSFDNSESVFDLLDWLADIPYLPLLRRISIEFHNCGFTDLFDNMRLVIFPPQVTDLDISFSFAEGTSPKRIRDLQKDMPLRIPEGLPLNHIKRLGIFGGGVSPVLGLLVTSCTSLRAVRTDLIDSSTVEEEKDYLEALREVCNDRCMSLELC